MSDVCPLIQLLERATNERRWCTGYQVAYSGPDGAVTLLNGGIDALGSRIEDDSMWPIYCAGKPVATVVAMHLVNDGELSLDDVLGDLIEGDLHPGLRKLTVRQILAHDAGLWPYPAYAFLGMSQSVRDSHLRELEPAGLDLGTRGYSEYAGWELLRLAIEGVTGQSFVLCVSDTVLRPLALLDDMSYVIRPDHRFRSRLRINVDLQDGKCAPLLWEATDSRLADISASSGLIASMRGLHEFYRWTICEFGKSSSRDQNVHSAELRKWTTPKGRHEFDRVLGRACTFGYGFMTDLAHHSFSGNHSGASFGHSGLHGMTFGAADPMLGVAYAVHLNGVTAHDRSDNDLDRSPQARRRALSCAILTAVGVGGP